MPIYLALDTETTGLDPQRDYVLEVAWACGTSLRTLHDCEISSTVISAGWDHGEPETLCDDYVTEMHTASGLFALIQAARDLNVDQTLFEVESAILEDLEWFTLEQGLDPEEPVYLVGNSVHFDRGFIEAQMPRLAKRISHRIIDVTSFLLVEEGYGLPSSRQTVGTAHRAADDIAASLEMLRASVQGLAGIRA